MRKKVLSWLLAIAMTAGSLVPSSQAFAAENQQELTDDAGSKEAAPGEEKAEDETEKDEESVEEKKSDTEKVEDENAKTEDGEKKEEKEENEESLESGETAEDLTDEEAKPEAALEVKEEAKETLEVKETEELTLSEEAVSENLKIKIESVDLKYGESADNTDGHLDRLFAPVVSDGDISYELKTEEPQKDALTFTTSYKFIADKAAFDIEEGSFAKGEETASFDKLTYAERADAYKALEVTELDKAAAGSKLYVAVMAVTSDEKAAFGVFEVNIAKRPVAIEFPATEGLSVSAETFPEDGLITVEPDSELFSQIAVTADDDKIRVPEAAEFITGSVTVDLNGLDLAIEGYQPADALYELNEELFANYEVTAEDTWPVYVAAPEAEPIVVPEEGERLGKALSPQRDEAISVDEVGFMDDSTISPSVTVKSRYSNIPVEYYIATNAKRTGAELLGDAYVDGKLGAYDEEYDYLKANSDPIEFKYLDVGMTYYIFARFYTGEGKKGYVECKNNIVLTTTPSVAPAVPVVIPYTSDEYKGSAIFRNPGDSRKNLMYADYGSDVLKEANHYGDDEGSGFIAEELVPGHYYAFYSGYDMMFGKTMGVDSATTDFYVDEGEADLQEIHVFEKTRGTRINNGDGLAIVKGKTMQFETWLEWSSDTKLHGSNEVTYTSSNPKAVSVDKLGTIKGLKVGESATITITPVDENAAHTNTFDFIVNVVEGTQFKLKTAKFDKAVETFTFSGSSSTARLNITLDKNIGGCPITWYSDDYSVVCENGSDGYVTEAKPDGTASIGIRIKKPGKAVITANVGGAKTISCTVYVNGTSGEGQPYYLNGKAITGFWGFKREEGKEIPVAAGMASLKKGASYIKYYDPVSLLPAQNKVVTDKKKMYVFGENYALKMGMTKQSLVEARINSVNRYFLVNTAGEIQTGWQKVEGIETYASPTEGYLISEAWVPRGKGVTWVDDEGLMRDDAGVALSKDSLHNISGKMYCFKGGLRQSGFVYLDPTDNIIAAKEVIKKNGHASYFNPADGVLVTENTSATTIDEKFFWVNGKKYHADVNGVITVGDSFDVEDPAIPSGSEGHYKFCYADSTGAIYVGRLFTEKGKTFYADEDGFLVCNDFATVGGKIYHFDENGELDCTNEGVATTWRYPDPEDGTRFKQAYVKVGNPKKPTAGTFFYTDDTCSKKLTNTTLLRMVGSAPTPTYYLDKNGNLASGIFKMGAMSLYFDPETCMIGTSGNPRIITFKGKKYLCNKDGSIVLTQGEFVQIGTTNKWVRLKDKNGTLMTGVQTINKKRYLFSGEGVLAKPSGDMIFDFESMKFFLAEDHPDPNDPSTWNIKAPGKVVLVNGHIFNKDGSRMMNGWATVEGKKYYVYEGSNLHSDSSIFKIGGKYYYFGTDGVVQGGWKKVTNPSIADMTSYISEEFSGDFYFYFNEKSGVMVTGWQTMPTLRTLGGKITDFPKTTGLKKKIYFNAASTKTVPVGALASNMDLTVSKMFYRFDADGTVKSGKEGLVYTDPTSDSSDGIKSYLKADGTMAKGRTLVKLSTTKAYFYFDLDKGQKVVDVLRKTGKSWFYYGTNGQQTSNIEFKEVATGEYVSAVLNNDGSIKYFIRHDGSGEKLKNCTISSKISKEIYILGGDGLPRTGIITDSNTGYTVMVDADGRNAGKYDVTSTDYKVIKSGNKYYMTRGGMILTRNVVRDEAVEAGVTDLEVTLDMFEDLPAADYNAIKAMFERNDMCYSSSDNIKMTICLNQDGSVYVGKISEMGQSLRTNKYGLLVEAMTPFVNEGGWKLAVPVRFGHKGVYATNRTFEIEAVDLKKALTTASEEDYTLDILLKWDENGYITFTDTKGNLLTGEYVLEDGPIDEILVMLKNGKLAFGKKTYNIQYMGIKITVDYNKEYGYGLMPYAGK